MRPAWALSIRWKSGMVKVAVAISLSQGCPSWGEIWRKAAANLWPEGHELELRLTTVGWVCKTRQNPCYRRLSRVNGAGIWRKRQRSYPGRSDGTPVSLVTIVARRCWTAEVSRGYSTCKVMSEQGRTERDCEGCLWQVRERSADSRKSQQGAILRRKWWIHGGLRNRRIPNGTYGGVGGRLIRCV